MKKLFILVLSFMLILSISVVFINVGNTDFADTPAGSISQSPLGAEITLEDEGAEIAVAAVGVDNDTITYNANNVATWGLDSQYTYITETIVVKSGYTLNIESEYSGRAFITKPSDGWWAGPHFKVEQGGTLNITGKNNAVIAIESESKENTSAQVVVSSDGDGSAVIDFDYVQLSNNFTSSDATGGGICFDGACSKIEMTNCSLWCFGKYTGSAYTIGGEASAIRFTENFKYTGTDSTGPVISGCSMDECYSPYGGFIRYEAKAENVSNLTISGNTFGDPASTAYANYGGVISIEGGVSGAINISGNTFKTSKATYAGGAVYISDTSASKINFTSNKFTSCVTTQTGSNTIGGAICIADGSTSTVNFVSGNTFSDCNARYGGILGMSDASNATVNINYSYLDTDSTTYSANKNSFSSSTAVYGGAVYAGGGTLNLNGGDFNANKATHGGGAIYVNDKDNDGNTYFNLSGADIYNNTATISGGGVYLKLGAKDAYKISSGRIRGNSSPTYGGALFVHASYATIENTAEIYTNHAPNGGAIGLWLDEGNATLNITGGTIRDNYATKGSNINSNGESTVVTGNGGAIWLAKESDVHKSADLLGYYATLNISGGKIYDSLANGTGAKGGAIFGDTDSVINISGGVIGTETTTSSDWTNNINKAANGYGGAIYQNNGKLSISGDALIQTCSALNGGGIYCVGSEFNMSGGQVSNATANYDGDGTGYGAGIYLSDCTSVKMTGGTITGCTSTYGGGVSINGASVDENGDPTINILGGTITGNKAHTYGGGIYIHKDSNVVIGGNATISQNQTVSTEINSDDLSARRGGGIYVGNGGSLKLCGSAVVNGNKAFMGGGIYFCKSTSAVIDGTEDKSPTISENRAGDSGGGIVVDGCTLTVNYAQILDNIAEVEDVVYRTADNPNISTDETNFGGGGILLWLEDKESVLEFKNGVMSGNMAWDGSGGAICSSRKYKNDVNKGYINIYGGKFTSNQAGNGGAIYSDYLSVLNMTGGTIGGLAKNSSDYKTITSIKSDHPPIKVPSDANYAMSYVPAGYDTGDNDTIGDFGGGGAMYIRGEATLENVEILGNLAARGGGIDLGTSTYTSDDKLYSGKMISKNCVYNGNISTDSGGGIYLTACDNTYTIANFPQFTSTSDEICENVAVNGGGIFAGARTIVDLTGVYVNNNLLRYYLYDAAFGSATANGGQIAYGAGIYSQGATLTTNGSAQNYCSISGNRALDPETEKDNVNIIDSTYPKTNVRGGALFSWPTATNIISYTYISDNEAYDMGGALYVASTKGATFSVSKVNPGAKTVLDNVIISNNTLTSTFYDAPGTTTGDIASNGAGVYVTVGGAFQLDSYYNNPTVNNSNFAMTNCQINGNVCTGFGGGLFLDYYYQDDSTELFSNNKIFNNTAAYGGGINFAVGVGNGSSSYKKVTMATTDVYGNTATVEGGGIRSNGYVIYTGDVHENNAPMGGGLYVASGTFTTTSIITDNTAIVGGGVYASAGSCTVNLVDGKAPVYNNFADPVAGNSTLSEGDDVYAKSGATLVIPGVKVYYSDDENDFGIWYSDYNEDRFRTGPDLVNNALIKNVTTNTTAGTHTSTGEVAATLKLPTANVSLGKLEAFDPWGNEYDPQVEVSDGVFDSKYQYEFVICKDNMILSKEDFAGNYEFIAYSITDEDGKTVYGYFKDTDTGSVFVSPGETLAIGGLVGGSQIRMYTPADDKIMTSFVKSVDAEYSWESGEFTVVTEKAKSGISVVKRITTDAIPQLETVESYTAEITNRIFGTKVTVNYYDRKVEKGVAADINTDATTISKTYIGPNYVYYFNNSGSSDDIQLNNYSYMITGAGVAANNKERGIDNIIDQYYLWDSQAGAVVGVKNTIYPGTENTYETYFGSDYNFANHTGPDGKFVTTDNSKWVTYTTASGTEVTPDVYNNLCDKFSQDDLDSITNVDVWLFNTPKVYTVKVYSAQREGHLGNKYGNYIVSDNEPRIFSAYYNQRFNGEMGDDSDNASSHLLKYNDDITGYIDDYISTSYRIRRTSGTYYFFQYWSYDPEGKVVASTDISYAHRVTADVELYAIYGQGEFWDTGLTLLENSTDFYHSDFDNDGVLDECVRFNTINTPYNTKDVTRAASIFLVFDSENVTVNETKLRNALQTYLDTITDKGAYGLEDLTDDVKSQITLTDSDGKTIEVTVVIDVYDIVDSITDSSDSHDITKTTLDRVQFYKEYKLQDVVDKTVLSLGGMYDSDSWYVSTNCVEYFLSSVELDNGTGEGDLGVGDGDIDWE